MPARIGTLKKGQISKVRISEQKPPTEAGIAKALAAKEALPGDIAAIQARKLEDQQVDKYEPIVFSDAWYGFSVFAYKFGTHPKTAAKWLKNGWLPYWELEKMRFINKFDIEDMMLRFRKKN